MEKRQQSTGLGYILTITLDINDTVPVGKIAEKAVC